MKSLELFPFLFLLLHLAFSAVPCDVGFSLPEPYNASASVWHPRLKLLLVGSDDGQIVKLDLNTSVVQSGWRLSGDVEGMTVANPDSDFIYVALETPPTIVEFNFVTAQVTRQFSLSDMAFRPNVGLEALAFIPTDLSTNGGYFYAASQANGKVYVYDLPLAESNSGTMTVTSKANFAVSIEEQNISGMTFNGTHVFALLGSAHQVAVWVLPASKLSPPLSSVIKYSFPKQIEDAESISVDSSNSKTMVYIATDSGHAVYSVSLTAEKGLAGVACTACTTAAQCEFYQGCVASKCDYCTTDAHCVNGDACAGGRCFPAIIPRWDLAISPSNLTYILDEAKSKNKPRVPCTIDGTPCRVRLRGSSSLEYPKKSFRIEVEDGLPHPGFSRHMNLRAEWNDNTYLRNIVSHQLFTELTDVPTPRTRFVVLYLNGERYGLMVEVQYMGKRFLNGNFLSTKAPLYEADPSNGSIVNGSSTFIKMPNNDYALGFGRVIGDNDVELADFINNAIYPSTIAGNIKLMRPLMDVDRYLQYLATVSILQSQDHVKKNFFFSYQPKSTGGSEWLFIPWDMELTLGCMFNDTAPDFPTNCYTMPVITNADYRVGLTKASWGIPTYPTELYFNLVITNVFNSQDDFWKLACLILNYTAAEPWLTAPALVDGLAAIIQSEVAIDERDQNPSVAEWQESVNELKTYFAGRTDYFKGAVRCEPPDEFSGVTTSAPRGPTPAPITPTPTPERTAPPRVAVTSGATVLPGRSVLLMLVVALVLVC